ncbi:hypothetical protein SANTM175S_07724 [Streptomyces antimycoticus]
MLEFVEDAAEVVRDTYVQAAPLSGPSIDVGECRCSESDVGDALVGLGGRCTRPYLCRACRRWRWFQIKVRSRSSRLQVCTRRDTLEKSSLHDHAAYRYR